MLEGCFKATHRNLLKQVMTFVLELSLELDFHQSVVIELSRQNVCNCGQIRRNTDNWPMDSFLLAFRQRENFHKGYNWGHKVSFKLI